MIELERCRIVYHDELLGLTRPVGGANSLRSLNSLLLAVAVFL